LHINQFQSNVAMNMSVLLIIFSFNSLPDLKTCGIVINVSGVFDHCEVLTVHHVLEVSRRLTHQYLLYCPVYLQSDSGLEINACKIVKKRVLLII